MELSQKKYDLNSKIEYEKYEEFVGIYNKVLNSSFLRIKLDDIEIYRELILKNVVKLEDILLNKNKSTFSQNLNLNDEKSNLKLIKKYKKDKIQLKNLLVGLSFRVNYLSQEKGYFPEIHVPDSDGVNFSPIYIGENFMK